MSETNSGKRQIGDDAQNVIEGYLSQVKQAGFIQDFVSNYYAGYAGKEKKQFYAPFLVELKSGEKWIIYSTTSLRDRIKGCYWDAENLIAADETIKTAYIVYLDGISDKEKKRFEKLRKRIKEGKIYCPISDVLPFSEFQNLMRGIGTEGKSSGYVKGADGRAFEARVASALRNKANLRVLKGKTGDSMTSDMEILEAFLDAIGVKPADVSYILAYSDSDHIKKLPSGGPPKTDVLCYIVKTDGTQIVETISCKNTDGDSVSVGQHKADDICDAIDPSNDELRNLLNKWQIEGTLSAFSEADSARLTELLNPLMEKFCNYVIGGVGGLGDQTTQWARYVIVCHADPNDIDV